MIAHNYFHLSAVVLLFVVVVVLVVAVVVAVKGLSIFPLLEVVQFRHFVVSAAVVVVRLLNLFVR